MIVAVVEDRLQVYSLCEIAYEEVPLRAEVASNVVVAGGSAYLALAGGALVRLDLP